MKISDFLNVLGVNFYTGVSDSQLVDNFRYLDNELIKAKLENKLTFIEVISSIGSRNNLGRPTITPIENKDNFMKNLNKNYGD